MRQLGQTDLTDCIDTVLSMAYRHFEFPTSRKDWKFSCKQGTVSDHDVSPGVVAYGVNDS